jgi:hypothetical protein
MHNWGGIKEMHCAYTLHYNIACFHDSDSNDLGLLIEATDQLPFSLQKYCLVLLSVMPI